MFFVFSLSYIFGFSSVFLIENWMSYYLIGMFTYSILLFRTFPDKGEKGIVHAIVLGFASAIMYEYLRGEEFIYYLWLLLTIPFFYFLSKGKTLFLQKNNYEVFVLLASSAAPICLVVMLKLWGIQEDIMINVFLSLYFAMIMLVQVYIRKLISKVIFTCLQTGILYYLYNAWVDIEKEKVIIIAGSLMAIQIYHFSRGYKKLIPRLNNS